MNQEIYESIVAWFNNYTGDLSSENEEIQLNIDIKRNHSLNSVEKIDLLTQSIDINETELLVAKTAALLHDIGRFEQLIKHETFSDTEQVNHIDLGIDILKQENVLSELTDEFNDIVLECIKFHDTVEIPKSVQDDALKFIQLIRDADRIDILDIVSKYYSESKPGTNKRFEMELADKPEISKKVFKSIMDEKVVCKKDILTLNDLKLHQMSWIYDLNLQQSFKIVSEKNYLKQIYDSLPKKDEIIDMYRQMKIYLENNL